MEFFFCLHSLLFRVIFEVFFCFLSLGFHIFLHFEVTFFALNDCHCGAASSVVVVASVLVRSNSSLFSVHGRCVQRHAEVFKARYDTVLAATIETKQITTPNRQQTTTSQKHNKQ